MPTINISALGGAGVHSLSRTNVNLEGDFLYFLPPSAGQQAVPSQLSQNNLAYIYRNGAGELTGITDDSLVYVRTLDANSVQLSTTSGGSGIDITAFENGTVSFNKPEVFNNQLNIDASTPTNQAVKYFTNEEPLTNLVSGSTYFLKNVDISSFSGTQALYSLASNTHTFTTCGRTGRLGPTQSEMRASYTTTWDEVYLSQGAFQGYQDWTVPVSGIYQLEARGAGGFNGTGSFSRTINQTSLTNNVASIRTTAAHNLEVGRSITISGASNAVYNGTYSVLSVINSTEFTFSRINANIGTAGSAGTIVVALASGRGAIVRGRVTLTKGEIITIAVGQVGAAPLSGTTMGGAGGGTFVVRKAGNEPLFVAGGGSAEPNTGVGLDGVLTQLGGLSTNGLPAGGSAGFGGIADRNSRSAAGGGFNSRGQNSSTGEAGGGSFLDGLVAAAQTGGRTGGSGGFGGGGSSDGQTSNQAGGGGGFSGGGGARSTTANHAGGGGGSFIVSNATNVATSNGTYDGASTFNSSEITNLAAYNTGEGAVVVTLVSSFTTGNEVYPTAADAQAGTNRISISANGSSFHAFVPINYDSDNDLIHSAAEHGLLDGEAIIPTFTSTPPAGLTNGTIYYVNKVSNYTYRLQSLTLPSTFSTINLTIPSARAVGGSDSVARVVVNTVTNTLTITAHGFLVDQPIRYDNGSGNPAGVNTGSIFPLQHLTTYYVAEVVNANQIRLKVSLDAPVPIDFGSAGTGTAHSFIFITVNDLEDSLYIPNHGLVSGQAVRYSNGGGTTIPGLTNNATYFIIRQDASIVKLSTTANLLSPANITGVGTGTHSLLITSLNYDTDTITIPAHGFLQKELVLYDAKGQTVVNGLTTATPYYVIFVNGDNIKLATTPENADSGTAVDITDTPAGVGVHSLQSLSKTPDGIYTISTVPTPRTFTAAAAGRVPTITKTFNPRSAIDLNLSAFKIPSHGFLTGTEVTYFQGDAATDISGLEDDTHYYVVAINRDYLRLSTTPENAAAGITLAVTDFGTGVAHSFVTNQINGNITGGGSVSVDAGSVLVNGTGTQFSKILKVGDRFRLFPPNATVVNNFASGNINVTNNRIVSTAHGFVTGDTVVFSANGGVSPSPLIDQYYYFTREVDANSYTLHSSAADAASNSNAVDITTTGTVGASGVFTFTKTTPVGPIVRRITAVGSDTQISVDRPYALAYNTVSYSFPTFVYVRPEGYSLHRPFDGGVEMSAGAQTSFAQIVRQTRKYFRYQSGKGLQTSCGINFKPSIDVESMIKFSETTIEVKTRRPHGLISGLTIEMSEATDSFGDPSQVYNGQFQVTVVDLTTFRVPANGTIVENKAYGFPQFYVVSWQNGAVRTGMFDFQNGMFFEFDGQKIYAVRRSSTQQIAGTVAALQGSELIFGTNTQFEAQLDVGDYVVLRGQSYRIVEIESDTRMSVRPEYKGSSGTEKEFNPQVVVNTSTDVFAIIGHGFSDLLPVVYNSIDGEPVGGLINGRTYYIDLIDNNSFRLKALPDANDSVNLSSTGTTTVHSFVPAKSGIIVTKTVDTRVPQEDWSIDPCDGSGVTGYNLDLSKIQMAYIDYSWYGAGKIRFGFKTTDGQVQYVHEFVHNNLLYESYLRSGNLPGRYEVVTYENPTYIPFLFHWGTSVMMDGRFDDDNSYLFTQSGQALTINGTTAKSFSAAGVSATTDLITIPSHGFATGDIVQYEGIATNGLRGVNTQNTPLLNNLVNISTATISGNVATITTTTPHGFTTATSVLIENLDSRFNGIYTIASASGSTFTYARTQADVTTFSPTGAKASTLGFYNKETHLTNAGTYVIFAPTPNSVGLFPRTTGADSVSGISVATSEQSTTTVTINTSTKHGLVTGNIVRLTGLTRVPNYAGPITRTSDTAFTYPAATATVANGADTAGRVYRLLDFTATGNTQYTFFLYPNGSLNNTSGPNYQPLISLRLSPSVSSGLTGKLGDRDVINRMQLRLQEIGISTTQLLDVKVLLNPRLNNLNFQGVDSPSLTQVVEHTSADTVSGGVQVYNFRAAGGSGGAEDTTTVDVSSLFELSNSILGGDSIYPDGPDILTIAVSRLTGNSTLASAKLSWAEAQA